MLDYRQPSSFVAVTLYPEGPQLVYSMLLISRLVTLVGLLAFVNSFPDARAQQEFPPPQGKGRLVLLGSGMSGPSHYTTVAREIAQLGYDVVLFDGNAMENTHGQGVKAAIEQAPGMPHALPGKMALVGFSLGGGELLFYGTQSADQVAVAIVWYPATTFIQNVPGFVSRLGVPVVMFAGEKDTYRNCCLVAKAHILADAAKAQGLPFELIVYPKTDHDFVKGSSHYNAEAYSDAFQRTADRLKQYLGN
jgi:dienelactone hydrolase